MKGTLLAGASNQAETLRFSANKNRKIFAILTSGWDVGMTFCFVVYFFSLLFGPVAQSVRALL